MGLNEQRQTRTDTTKTAPQRPCRTGAVRHDTHGEKQEHTQTGKENSRTGDTNTGRPHAHETQAQLGTTGKQQRSGVTGAHLQERA